MVRTSEWLPEKKVYGERAQNKTKREEGGSSENFRDMQKSTK